MKRLRYPVVSAAPFAHAARSTASLCFTVAAALCGAATTLPLLIAARALQGLGAAIMMAISMALRATTWPIPLCPSKTAVVLRFRMTSRVVLGFRIPSRMRSM